MFLKKGTIIKQKVFSSLKESIIMKQKKSCFFKRKYYN